MDPGQSAGELPKKLSQRQSVCQAFASERRMPTVHIPPNHTSVFIRIQFEYCLLGTRCRRRRRLAAVSFIF